jgi:hypothetical protein
LDYLRRKTVQFIFLLVLVLVLVIVLVIETSAGRSITSRSTSTSTITKGGEILPRDIGLAQEFESFAEQD